MSDCSQVHDDLDDIVAGDSGAIARHSEHLASCDECRDLRHEATELAAHVAKAGNDYVPPADLAARVLAKIDADAKPASTVESTVEATPAPKREPSVEKPAKDKVVDKKVTPIESKRKLPRAWLTLVAASAVAAGGIVTYKMRHSTPDESSTKTPIAKKQVDDKNSIGTVSTIARASTNTSAGSGVSVRGASGDWRPLAKGEVIPVGGAVRTDERTRVSFDMKDGTKLILDHATELAFDGKDARAMSLAKGRVVADVAHVENHPAKIVTPDGTIDVLGTKLVVTAAPKLLSVQVVRGEVAVTSNTSQRAEVHAGEEAVIEGAAFNVSSAPSLVNELSWSELIPAQKPDEVVTSGLGSLRAYKPGEKRDRDWNLALAKHDVKVRISGPIARTEITETFRNDSDTQLEGVYQFPLPSDAQIDGLELDVKDAPGGFLAGAFIDKSRAAKIWQGVIDKATPKIVERPSSEIIWVPGRWRDPALLDWKRGGRFELKIFPIPAKGSRTIKIAYTQVVNARGPFRQYVYPLAHSTDGSTVADNFTVDVEVRGAMPGLVRTLGYDMQRDPSRADVNALTMQASGFVPKGDITVDYRANDGDAELRAWTFAGGAAVPPDEKLAKKKGVGIDPKVVEAQRKVAADARPTAVLALRPNLPRSRETKPRDYMIVVDSSQSMVGERYTRASELAIAMIGQMDRRDRFSVSACDTDCRTLGDLRAPSEIGAKEAKAFLAETQPAGASDLVGAIRKASDFASDEGRQKWVLFVGDGFSTTGFRRAAQVEQALADVAQKGVQVNTIGIGGDADTALLSAAARGGGGTHLAWTPGQTVQTIALTSIESTNGAQLRNATVELPAGLADVAPTILPTLRSGEEVLIAARIDGAVKGKVVLKGLVGNEPFTQEYPLELAVSSSPGNAFVPRLWATLAIQQLERRGQNDDRLQTIALSQGFGVMSKETSLLVLESAAMFEAFGVDRSQPANKWSGEDSLDEVVTTGAMDIGGDVGAATAQPTTKSASAGYDKVSDTTMALDEGKAGKKSERAAEPKKDAPLAKPKAPAPTTAPLGRANRGGGGFGPADSMDPFGGTGTGVGMGTIGTRPGMIAMRRTWVRVPSLTPYDGVRDNLKKVIETAEAALVANPDSREKHRALVQALAYAGELDRARDIAAKWLERDKLDPQALDYTAGLLGRDGQRELALRTLAGLIDLDADRVALHERMVKAYETAGRLSHACSHRIAISAINPRDMNLAGAAMRCLRSVGRTNDAEIVRMGLVDDAQRAAAEKAATVAPVESKLGGDLVVNAKWQGNVDLDLSLITPSGERVSWMGGRTDAAVGDASSNEKETLALKRLKRGQYLIEISRGANSSGPITGTVDISVLGTRRSMPFQLLGSHVTVTRLVVNLEERMEQVTNPDMIPVPVQPRVNIGSAGDDVANRIIRSRAGVFRACYQRELARNPSLQGRLDVTFTVLDDGTVPQAMAGGSMGNEVASCVQRQVTRFRFPAGNANTYRFQLTFNAN
ncbi:MAG: AgmX/PglI C-terminal domain-containing protein [Kofleriaceae bacterium]